MNCVIYKGAKRADTYLYVERKDDFQRVPQALLAMLGTLELVMELELAPDRRLAQADVVQVRENLVAQGYFLQMPPRNMEDASLQARLGRQGFYMKVPKK